MQILWETPAWSGASISPTKITFLTWMPHATPPTNQQQLAPVNSFIGASPSKTRGFLAVGTETGVIGICVTDTADHITFEEQDLSRRLNFNLRGHHSRIQRCSWNVNMTKLASCDENGIIYVWVPNDERWSVELVNDRGLKVRDFDWSKNGQAALILYEDNFVLIGSANGQRIWSNTFLQKVNCGAWAPTSKELVLGLENGQIQVYNDQGLLIADRQLLQVPIQRVAFSPLEHNYMLAVVSSHNQILFLNSSYEMELQSWQSSDPIRMVQWSSDGKMLAVVCETGNIIILNNEARLIHSFVPPLIINDDSVISFTWAHNDEVVVVASNGGLAVGRVQSGVPALNDLVGYQIWLSLGRTARDVHRLGLPERSSNMIRQYDRHVIRCRIPSYERMCRFVCEPTFWRWYCTIVPIPRKNFHYMLCLEHLGGLVPILLGRQINRVIPQFIISLPPSTAFSSPGYSRGRFAIPAGEHQIGPRWDFASNGNPNLPLMNQRFLSDSEPIQPPSIDDPAECGYTSTVGTEFSQFDDDQPLSFNNNQCRNTVWRRSKRQIKKFVSKRLSPRSPKASRMLCHVRSNVWCTRFKITSPGIKDLPMTLAQVVYKTSVLHLQPRQMTISLCDLRPLTKTMIDPSGVQNQYASSTLMPLQSALSHRKHRSADSSPAELRRNASSIDELDDDDELMANNNDQQVGQGVVSPAVHLPPQQQQVIPNVQQRLTYAETRARLLQERRPIRRVPVAQQGQNAAAQTGRRARRSALRFLRRAAEDQQPMIGEPQQLAGRRPAPNPPPVPVLIEQPAIQAHDPRLRQRHVRFRQNGEAVGLDDSTGDPAQNELLEDEKLLYANVRAEFDSLCEAVGAKVAQMRSIADELDDLKQQSSTASTSTTTQKRRAQFAAHRSATTTDFTALPQQQQMHWQKRVESLDYIDDDAPAIIGNTKDDRKPLIPRMQLQDDQSNKLQLSAGTKQMAATTSHSASSSPTKKPRSDLKIVDKLAEWAADMRLKSSKKVNEDKQPLLANAEKSSENEIPSMLSSSTPTTVEQMREHFRDIARKTAQIEDTLDANEIHGDLKLRIQGIKAILGETPHAADLIEPSRGFARKHQQRLAVFDECRDEITEIQSERGSSPTTPGMLPLYETIRMQNKTPFWNDESQVYQLDFGGRVTQESAKNFQIEHDHDQVMQFGRIENGAYTLDFCSPLSAVQAFGIALASITQRLK